MFVACWIVLNTAAVIHHWDPFPFILLNLSFSTQAAYAAPLILLAQNRQEDRDRASIERDRDVAAYCAPLTNNSAGRQRNGQVAGARDTVYGSDNHDRPVPAVPFVLPAPLAAGIDRCQRPEDNPTRYRPGWPKNGG